jgi:hypothetical protein
MERLDRTDRTGKMGQTVPKALPDLPDQLGQPGRMEQTDLKGLLVLGARTELKAQWDLLEPLGKMDLKALRALLVQMAPKALLDPLELVDLKVSQVLLDHKV